MIPYLNANLKINSGIYVAQVLADGPLYKSGLQVGDIIVRIDNTEINRMNDLRKYIYSKTPGESVNLEIKRNDKIYRRDIEAGIKIKRFRICRHIEKNTTII